MIEFTEASKTDNTLSGESLGRFFEHLPQAVFLEDGQGLIVEVNPAACRLYRRERPDLCFRHAAEVLPPKLRGSSSRDGRRESVLEIDGRSIPVEVLSTSAKVQGENGYVTMVWTVPQSVEKVERMDTPQEAMELMAGRLAHRFNNILTTFSGYGSLIERDLEQGIIRAAHVRRIIDAAAEAQEVTGDLLRFSRKQPAVALSPLDLNAFITGYVAEMRERVGACREVELDLKDSPLRISGNREALDGIFARIARNIADYVPAETTVTVSTAREEGNGVIRVRDRGEGILPEQVGRVFDPFYTTSSDPASLGLGLSVVRGLVVSMNGSVSANSVDDGGSELVISFPLLDVEPEPESEQAAQGTMPELPLFESVETESETAEFRELDREDAAAGDTDAGFESKEMENPFQLDFSTMETQTITQENPVQTESAADTQQKKPGMPKGTETILVVEDEPMVRELVTRSLTYLGYNVIKAEDGQHGYETALENKDKIDMIFSDIVMPRVSGPEMVHRLADKGETFRVLFTTGFTENKRILVNGEIREGVNLLPKPYTTRELAERIRQALDGAIVPK